MLTRHPLTLFAALRLKVHHHRLVARLSLVNMEWLALKVLDVSSSVDGCSGVFVLLGKCSPHLSPLSQVTRTRWRRARLSVWRLDKEKTVRHNDIKHAKSCRFGGPARTGACIMHMPSPALHMAAAAAGAPNRCPSQARLGRILRRTKRLI